MGNVIQIKRGSGIPGKNALKNGELGYDQTNKRLYIGDRNGNAVSLAEPPLPHTVLTKPQCYYVKTGETDQGDPVLERRECSGTDRILRIICSNLQSGKTYKIYLYTEQRYRGHAKHRWRHPHNDEQYTAEGALKTGAFTGFLNIAGTDLPDSKLLHPDVPDWMEESGRGGVLQTEWEFTPTSSEHVFDLQLNKWLVEQSQALRGPSYPGSQVPFQAEPASIHQE